MTGPTGFEIWGVERREASREGRPEASRETRDQEVTSDFPNKSRHREYPRRHDGTHRLCDLGEERREASREGRREASHETREQGGNFRPRTKTHFPRPRASTYRKKTASGVEGTSGIPSQNLLPPLAESPFC